MSVLSTTNQGREPTKAEVAVVVANALGEVDVAVDELALHVAEAGAEDGDAVVALEGEGDLLGAPGEVAGTPLKVAWRRDGSAFCSGQTEKKRRTVVVAKDGVEVELGLDGVAGAVVEDGTENVAVVDANVLSGGVERHGVCVCVWMRCDGDGSGE